MNKRPVCQRPVAGLESAKKPDHVALSKPDAQDKEARLFLKIFAWFRPGTFWKPAEERKAEEGQTLLRS